MVRHGCASHSEAATADCFFSHLQRRLPLPKSVHLIARVRLHIPRADAESPCWSCKMAEQFLNIMRMEDQRGEGGRSSAGQKVFGESLRWLRCTMDYSGSTT